MGYHGNILLKTNRRQERQKLKTKFSGMKGGEAETERLILWLVVVELLVGGWLWRGAPDYLSNVSDLST